MFREVHGFIEQVAKLLELDGVGVIVLGVVVATVLFLHQGRRAGDWKSAYSGYRANLGRGILLGLDDGGRRYHRYDHRAADV